MHQDDRILPPSPRKLRKAREKGEVPVSQTLTGAFTLLGGIVFIAWMFPLLWKRMKAGMVQAFSYQLPLDEKKALSEAFHPFVGLVTVFLLGIFLLTLFIVGIQKGMHLGWHPRKTFLASRPFQGGWRRGIFSILKITVLGGAAFFLFRHISHDLFVFREASWEHKGTLFIQKLMQLSLGSVAILLVIGVIECLYLRWRFLQDQRMTRQEVEEERRETEGNPQGKIHKRENKNRSTSDK